MMSRGADKREVDVTQMNDYSPWLPSLYLGMEFMWRPSIEPVLVRSDEWGSLVTMVKSHCSRAQI